MADPVLKVGIDDALYDPGSVLDKTLVADRDIIVYKNAPDKYNPKPEQLGIVKKGQPVGIVFSWLNPDPYNNRNHVWWIFSPAQSWSDYYYAPHADDAFDLSALRQQGVISVAEKIEEEKKAEEEENKAWYEKIIDKAVPVALTLGIGIAVITAAGNIIASRKKTGQ